jgi:hypothetical protein
VRGGARLGRFGPAPIRRPDAPQPPGPPHAHDAPVLRSYCAGIAAPAPTVADMMNGTRAARHARMKINPRDFVTSGPDCFGRPRGVAACGTIRRAAAFRRVASG